MSELFVRIHGFEVENDFEVYYSTGITPGSGFTQYNGTYASSTTEITLTGLSYDTQYWVKIVDTVNGSYIIENIRTHGIAHFLDECSASGVTPTPTPPTPTPTITPTITGATPTPTPTVTPTFAYVAPDPDTPTPTMTPTVSQTVTPTYTPTPTQTPTPLTLTKYCYTAIYNCGDTLHCEEPSYTNCGSVTYWDENGIEITEYYCKGDGLITVWSSQPPITVAMAVADCEETFIVTPTPQTIPLNIIINSETYSTCTIDATVEGSVSIGGITNNFSGVQGTETFSYNATGPFYINLALTELHCNGGPIISPMYIRYYYGTSTGTTSNFLITPTPLTDTVYVFISDQEII